MILVALGSNLPGPAGSPRHMVEAALAALPEVGVTVVCRSPWYLSAPVPPSDQPWFVNGVATVGFSGTPSDLLACLHAVEASLGRHRDGTVNAARTLDLDLLDMDGLIWAADPTLPHPRLHQRAFVLRPLADVAPTWRHPASGRLVTELLEALGPIEGLSRDPGDHRSSVATPPSPAS